MLGALLLLTASTGVGFSIARDYRARPRHLQAVMQTLRLLQADIEYSVIPLSQALSRVALRCPPPVDVLFRIAGQALKDDEISVLSAFDAGISQSKQNTALKSVDHDVIRAFGDSLSTVDRIHVRQQFHATLTQLEGLEQEAREARRRNEKLWQYLGVLTGLLLILLFY